MGLLPDPKNAASLSLLKGTQAQVDLILERINAISTENDYERSFESKFVKTSEAVNMDVAAFKFLQILLITGVAAFQIHNLAKFLRRNKFLECCLPLAMRSKPAVPNRVMTLAKSDVAATSTRRVAEIGSKQASPCISPCRTHVATGNRKIIRWAGSHRQCGASGCSSQLSWPCKLHGRVHHQPQRGELQRSHAARHGRMRTRASGTSSAVPSAAASGTSRLSISNCKSFSSAVQHSPPNLGRSRSPPESRIKISDDLEMILPQAGSRHARVSSYRVAASSRAAARLDSQLAAMYLDPFRGDMPRNCKVCQQVFRMGELILGYMLEDLMLRPKWIHIKCVRRARLQTVGQRVAHNPTISEATLQEALLDLGHTPRQPEKLVCWSYLPASVHRSNSEHSEQASTQTMAGSSVWAELFNSLPEPQSDYPPLDERPFPERFTDDFFRDRLPELEFRLEEACVKGNIQEVHDLILEGANKNAPLDKELKTPLMIACQLGWFHLVKWLVEFEGVDMDGPISRCGFRAIDYAGKEQFRWPNEEVEIADYLRSMGSNYTWWGACFSGDIERIDEYLQNGQDVNEINPVLWNYNAVDCAMHGGCGKAAQFLVARGGIITVRNCHIPVWDDMLWSIGRGDAFMYKHWFLSREACLCCHAYDAAVDQKFRFWPALGTEMMHALQTPLRSHRVAASSGEFNLHSMCCGSLCGSSQSTTATNDWQNSWQLAMDAFRSSRSCSEASFAAMTIMSAFSKSQQWLLAVATMRGVRQVQVEANTIMFSSGLASCSKKGLWKEQVHFLEEMSQHGISSSSWTWNPTITGCGKANEWTKSLATLSQIPRHTVLLSNTFNAVINALGTATWQKSLRSFSTMETLRVSPDSRSYTSIASTVGSSLEWASALNLFHKHAQSGLQIDAVSVNAAISACEKSSMWQHALSLLFSVRRTSRDYIRNIASYNGVISACGKGFAWRIAVSLLDDAAKSSFIPDTISFNAALNACDKSSQWVVAVDILRRMQSDRVQVDAITYTSVLGACEHSGQWEITHILLHRVIDGGYDEWKREDIDYVHYYQAGAPADCLKHLILCALLEHSVQEADPFLYIDTHAGSGLYDLSSQEAMRFENYRSGIQNLATSQQATTLRTMHGFFSAVRLVNFALGEESLRYYPGSPAIAQHFLRPQDSALVFEASREVCEVLQDSLLKLKQDAGSALSTTVVCANSYEWFARYREVPATSTSRVLALLDPPYDSASSSDKWNLFLLKHLKMRWPSSCILLWCPHIADNEMTRFQQRLVNLQVGDVLAADVKTLTEASAGDLTESRSSVLVVNPPAALEKQLGPVLEELQKSLSKGDFCRAASTSLRMLPKKAEAATVPGQAVRLQTRGHASILGGLVWNYSWPLVNVLLGTTPRGWQVLLQSPYDTTTVLTFINGKQFYLRRIEFTSPSENSLDGESFDMEMQLVHNAAADGQLLVTSVFLKVGLVEGNEYLNTFWPQFPSTVSEDGVQAEIANPFYALPGDRSLYAFNGSSTVPPCGTDTIWMVFKQPLMISRAQRDLYRAALNLSAPTGFLRFGSAPSGVVQPWNTDLGMNTRLPQPQGVRQVAFFPMSNPPSQMPFDLTSGHFWGFFGIGLLLLSVFVGVLALLCLLCSGGARAKGRARSKEVFHRSEETDEDRQPLYRSPEPAPTQMHRMPMPTQPQWPANAGRGMMTRPQIPQMSGARAPAMTQPMNFGGAPQTRFVMRQ
ncbi:rlmJ [Symbiodinium necroappetens]|uniref:RlmJ protein n=1 Tax=Symbiodinium necroappetens TaxID=1628268 RepID=A0A812MCP7_9DINO|nr:rlmJ [Symbiodinium necroappetens]